MAHIHNSQSTLLFFAVCRLHKKKSMGKLQQKKSTWVIIDKIHHGNTKVDSLPMLRETTKSHGMGRNFNGEQPPTQL